MIIDANPIVTAFASMIGASSFKIPYINHSTMPKTRDENITRDMSLVCRVFHVFMTWGRNDIVVIVPATIPRAVVKSIGKSIKFAVCPLF